MNWKRGCSVLLIAALMLGGLTVLAFAGVVYAQQQQAQARKQILPPVVLVAQPASGTVVSAGSYLPVTASVISDSPVIGVELWLDGELVEIQKNETAGNLSPYYVASDLLVPSEGVHTLFVRAAEQGGQMGQSPPVSFTGVPKPSETFQAIPVREGQGLEEIAAEYGIPVGDLKAQNPGIADPPPAGTILKAPAPGEAEAEPQDAQQPQPPAGSAPIQIPNIPMLEMAQTLLPAFIPSGPLVTIGSTAPAAPTNLQVEVKDCQKVTLRWDDNASDEGYYHLYMVPPTFQDFPMPYAELKASPSTGPAWHEFQSPYTGVFNLWVEAVNAFGASSSNIVRVYIPYVSGCPAVAAEELLVYLEDITLGSGETAKLYCYVSLEETPEQRIPAMEGSFVPVKNGKSQGQGGWASWVDQFAIPVPPDEAIDLNGKCLAWVGDDLKELGAFSGHLPASDWDGEKRTMNGGAYQIGISVKPSGGSDTPIGITATNPALPAPYAVTEEDDPQSSDARSRILRWKWDGDSASIDGFEIFLNGKPYDMIKYPKDREIRVFLPGQCGAEIRWQVAAKTGPAISPLSAPVRYDQPACQTLLRVSFDSLNLKWTDDGWPSGFACETLDSYFTLSAGNVTRSFWGGNSFLPIKCGIHSFSDMTGGPYKQVYGSKPYVIDIPLSPGQDLTSLQVKAKFMDHDDPGGDDLIASLSQYLWGTAPAGTERWGGSAGCWETITSPILLTGEAESTMELRFAVYPNICTDVPPPDGSP
jgi:LysM repeat protein